MRALRISSHKDYVAVDVVDDKDKILETPFYLEANKTKRVLYKDQESGAWLNTDIKISDDFKKLKLKDVDDNSDFTGMEWDSDMDELLDSNCIKFIKS